MPAVLAWAMIPVTLAGSLGETAMPAGFLARIDSKMATWAAASSVSGPRNWALTPSFWASASMPLRASTQYGLFSDLGRKTYVSPLTAAALSPATAPLAAGAAGPAPGLDAPELQLATVRDRATNRAPPKATLRMTTPDEVVEEGTAGGGALGGALGPRRGTRRWTVVIGTARARRTGCRAGRGSCGGRPRGRRRGRGRARWRRPPWGARRAAPRRARRGTRAAARC